MCSRTVFLGVAPICLWFLVDVTKQACVVLHLNGMHRADAQRGVRLVEQQA